MVKLGPPPTTAAASATSALLAAFSPLLLTLQIILHFHAAYLCSMRSLGVISQQVRQHNRQHDNSNTVGSSQLWIGFEKDSEA